MSANRNVGENVINKENIELLRRAAARITNTSILPSEIDDEEAAIPFIQEIPPLDPSASSKRQYCEETDFMDKKPKNTNKKVLQNIESNTINTAMARMKTDKMEKLTPITTAKSDHYSPKPMTTAAAAGVSPGQCGQKSRDKSGSGKKFCYDFLTDEHERNMISAVNEFKMSLAMDNGNGNNEHQII